MPASAARALSRRCRVSGTLRIWIITDMCTTCEHLYHMSSRPVGDPRAIDVSRESSNDYSPRRRGEDLALADMVGGADDAFGLHALDQTRGAVVADLQIALHKARRGLALARDERDGLVVQRIARATCLLA